MSQHDTLTLRDALRNIQYEAASLADAQVIALQALNATYPARAALSATQPAQAAQPDAASEAFSAMADAVPFHNGWVKPQAAQGEPLPEHADHMPEIAARLRLVARLAGCADAVPEDDRTAVGCIFSMLGNIRRALELKQAAQGAGEVVAGIIAEWRDVILNARHNMDGVLDNDQINEVLNVWDDMAIEVDRTIGTAVPSNAQAQLRAVEKLIDGSQPIDIPGALAVIRHGGTTPSTQPAAGADVLDEERWRYAMDWDTRDFAVCRRVGATGTCWEPIKTDGPIDAAIAASGRKE